MRRERTFLDQVQVAHDENERRLAAEARRRTTFVEDVERLGEAIVAFREALRVAWVSDRDAFLRTAASLNRLNGAWDRVRYRAGIANRWRLLALIGWILALAGFADRLVSLVR